MKSSVHTYLQRAYWTEEIGSEMTLLYFLFIRINNLLKSNTKLYTFNYLLHLKMQRKHLLHIHNRYLIRPASVLTFDHKP